ncbi:hypothetical protein GCM10027566_22630 [Arachidicoccus ginsenosidivorans]
MKKLVILIFTLLPLAIMAQNEEYTAYLEQAIAGAKNNDAKAFNTNLRFFSAAIDRDNITPSTLGKKNRELYTEALYQALIYSNIDISDEIAKKALKFIQYNIESNARNMFMMGRLYSDGKAVEQDYAQAKLWYERAAAKGDTWAMNNLGVLYHNGNGVTKDYAQAKYWYEKAADRGNEGSIVNIGVLYEFGLSVEKNYVKAMTYYKKAADMGDADGMDHLGDLYFYDDRLTIDYTKAKYWFEKASLKGVASAMNNLGWLYRYGKGGAQDNVKAKYWYEKAAKKGDAAAMSNLGLLYYQGKGVAENNTTAKYWFEKAAEKGNSKGMFYLGEIYDRGYGVVIDWDKAFEWYEKAAELEYIYGLRLAGEFYLFGVGGAAKIKSKAIALFEKAKEKGDKKAALYLQVLRDIENKKYHELNTSQYGNRILVEDEPLTAHQKNFPYVMTKFGVGWQFDVTYKKSRVGKVQIFPTYTNDKNRPEDDISFSGYAPSLAMSEEHGKQGYRLSWRLKRGYRAIGYTYITGHFPDNDKHQIKVPLALCWLPERYYK